MHLKCLLQLGYFSIRHGKCFQFDVKKGQFTRTLCSRWRHHVIHPFCSCILCIWITLFYSHHNCENNVIVLPSTMGTRQGDPLGGALFALIHFRVLHSIDNHFPSCLFQSITDDIHIIGPPSIVSFAYEHFKTKLCAIGLSIQLHKCVAWSPFDLPPNFNTPS
jgi:hypothetical protein